MRIVLAALAALSLSSCKRPPPPEPPAAAPRTAPLAQDGTEARRITSLPDRVKVKLDLAQARGAVRTWFGEKREWPPDLDSLDLAGVNYPDDLAYDAATGAVTSKTYPGF